MTPTTPPTTTPTVSPTKRVLAIVAAVLAAGCSARGEQAAQPAANTTTTTSAVAGTTTGTTGATGGAGGVSGKRIDMSAVSSKLDELVAKNALAGAGLVIVDGENGIIGEHYTGDITADRISLVASAAKSVTALVLARLADQGKVDLDAPISRLIDWAGPNGNITIAQLLSNSSGLVGLLDNPAYPPYVCQYLAAGTMLDCAKQILGTTADDGDVVPPDTRFRYGGAQWQVAGALAEVASGRKWADLVADTFGPCGLDTFAYNNHFTQLVNPAGPFNYPTGFNGDPNTLKPTENPNMEGGLYTTPRDYAQLLRMQLRGGTCGDSRIVSEAMISRMQTDRIGPAYNGSTGLGSITGYGMGWWVDRNRAGYVEDAGAFGTVPWLDTTRGYGGYLVIEQKAATGKAMQAELLPVIDAAVDAAR